MIVWEILMRVWDLHHLRRHHIVVHYVVQKGTDAVNTRWACSHQAPPLMTVVLCQKAKHPSEVCRVKWRNL